MKKIFFLFSVLFIFAGSYAQNPTTSTNNSDNEIYKEVDVIASFPGGMAEMHKFLGSKTTLGKFGEPGTEVIFKIEFVVEKDGSITDIKLVEDAGEVSQPLFDDYVKVIKEMPKWDAAKKDGKIVRSLYVLPIKIKFQEELKFKKQE